LVVGTGAALLIKSTSYETKSLAFACRGGSESPALEPSRTGRRQQQLNILSAENEVSYLEAGLAAPDFYAKPRAEIFDFETQLKTIVFT
jgi:hypothetical protein